MLLHMQRHRNKVIFLKCSDGNCCYCIENPPKAKKCFAMLQKMNMKLFAPLPDLQGNHYRTFNP